MATETKPILEFDVLKNVWTLAYLKGGVFSTLHFRLPDGQKSDFRAALIAGQNYCNTRNLKFLSVTSFLVDISDKDEE